MCQIKDFFEEYIPETRIISALEDKEIVSVNRSLFERLLTEYIIDSDRVNNALHRAGIFTVWDLLNCTIGYVKSIRFLGRVGLLEIEESLKSDNLHNVCHGSTRPDGAIHCIVSFDVKRQNGEDREQIIMDLIRDHERIKARERRAFDRVER